MSIRILTSCYPGRATRKNAAGATGAMNVLVGVCVFLKCTALFHHSKACLEETLWIIIFLNKDLLRQGLLRWAS